MTEKEKEKEITMYPDKKYYYVCLKSSCLFLVSFIYSIYKRQYELSLVPGGIFLTSINYWRKPVFYSLRRYIDIAYVSCSIVYTIFRAYNAEYANLFYLISAITVLFYPLSWYYDSKKQYWTGAYMHSMFHILANVAFIVLCSGYIPPIQSNDTIYNIDII